MLENLDFALFSLPVGTAFGIVCAAMALIATAAYLSKSLNLSGCIAAFIMGVSVLWCLEFEGFILFIIYFVLANTVGHFLSGSHKDNVEKKGSCRDWIQVLANGFWPMFASVMYFYTDLHKAKVMFAASVAASFSDTMAGDFGRLSKQNPVSIRTFKPVEKGTSGGVTSLGVFASFISAFVIAVLYCILFGFTLKDLFAITFAGFIASIADSFLGATCQIMYIDNNTGKVTEKSCDRDGNKNIVSRGVKWIDNDVVNFMANTFGSVISLILSLL